jgi:hypothetical protein
MFGHTVCGSCVLAGIVLGHIMCWVSYWLHVMTRGGR